MDKEQAFNLSREDFEKILQYLSDYIVVIERVHSMKPAPRWARVSDIEAFRDELRNVYGHEWE